MENIFFEAAKLIKDADALLITAGAGIGVDSGLPDFRGDKGFWNAYPMYEKLGLSFVDAANPVHFESDPPFGWGFYGHRLELYRKTIPHEGFNIIMNWIRRMKKDYFTVTSNVDGQFQMGGFEESKIYEIHGSIHYLQCTAPCRDDIWTNEENIEIDYTSMRAFNTPKCKFCGRVARPNILMFGDYSWIALRSHQQSGRYETFLNRHRNSKLAAIEMGAGTAIPSIRYTSERLSGTHNARIIRINPREPQISPGHISIDKGALESITKIDEILKEID